MAVCTLSADVSLVLFDTAGKISLKGLRFVVALPSCIVYDCTIVLSGTKIKYGDNPKHTKLLNALSLLEGHGGTPDCSLGVNYTDTVF